MTRACLAAACFVLSAGMVTAQRKIFLDTDAHLDCDDAGAIGLLHALEGSPLLLRPPQGLSTHAFIAPSPFLIVLRLYQARSTSNSFPPIYRATLFAVPPAPLPPPLAQGEAELIGMVHNAAVQPGAGAISAINHFYGKPDIPVGACVPPLPPPPLLSS
jgi:hypothetical protein